MNLSTTGAVRKAVFASLNTPHSICVFPNETIRRFWIQDYALKSEKGALLLNRVLAWDTFSSYFVETEGKDESDHTIRWIFAQQLIEQKSGELLFFIQPNFPHLNYNLTSSIVNLISRLSNLRKIEKEDSDEYKKLPLTYRQDIELIEKEYTQFLDERSLYDSSLIEKTECHEEDILTSSVDIFFPELCTSYSEFESYVEQLPHIRIFKVKSEQKVPLIVYENERIEIDSTFVRVKELLQQGVHLDDIIITVGSLGRMRRYVEPLANQNNLNLHIVSGSSIFDYSVGAMFLLFKEVHQHHFDVDIVKKLLLNPTIPWKEEALHHSLIERAIELHIHQRLPYYESNDWKKKLNTFYKDDKNLFNYAHRLFQTISSMVTSRSGNKIAQFLLMIQKNYFKEGAFAFDSSSLVQKEETQAYTFCLEQLRSLSHQLEVCKLEINSSLYSFFITLLKSKKFNPTGKDIGIRVYDWTHGVAVAPQYHFFINCSSSVVDSTISSAPLVPSFALLEEGEHILDYYMISGDNIIYSYSPSGFVNTTNLPPSFFVRHSLLQKAEHLPLTLLLLEEKAWQEEYTPPGVLFSTQMKEGYTYASSTFFKEKHIDLSRSGISLNVFDYVKNGDNLIPLSSSSIEAFESCPFKYISSKVFKLRAKEYDELILDHGEIGSIQHAILAQFFERVKDTFTTFDEKNRDEMSSLLQDVMNESVDKMLKRWGSSNYFIVQYINSHYFTPLFSIIDKEISLYNGNQTLASELALSYDDGELGFHLEGRIDRVITVEGDVVIIDYKKSSTPSKRGFNLTSDSIPSYQLPLYSMLIEKSTSTDFNQVDIASYYNIKDGKYVEIWNHDSELVEHLKLLSENAIEKMVEKIKSGNLGATPSALSCEFCDYRQLCRRRYSLP